MPFSWQWLGLLVPVGLAGCCIPFGELSLSVLDRIGFVRWGGEKENSRLG
jgi:hypothetical protein